MPSSGARRTGLQSHAGRPATWPGRIASKLRVTCILQTTTGAAGQRPPWPETSNQIPCPALSPSRLSAWHATSSESSTSGEIIALSRQVFHQGAIDSNSILAGKAALLDKMATHVQNTSSTPPVNNATQSGF
ncbi:hypothetical protein MAPG_09258 [Magnaporthiopsis poae ATCC 64411]|uniref:Uncharacterized protein n=1 Tax=Magnaporthiopsis poae (strain ATCC 64411 / 73-15) TaxID=644358 RepID=A0A0C4E9H3_MAGP6|nr:hypothetical protein MAPG_09258 [Magnaporthiopsis poae ATCC 64411]